MGTIDNSRKAVYGYDQRLEVFCSNGTAMANNEAETTTVKGNADGFLSAKPPYFFMQRYAPCYVEEVRQFIECVRDEQTNTHHRRRRPRRSRARLRSLEVAAREPARESK